MSTRSSRPVDRQGFARKPRKGALRALPNTDMEAHNLFPALGRGAENDQDALGLRLHPGLQIDAIRPDMDIPPDREIAALPVIVFLLPLPGQARNHA